MADERYWTYRPAFRTPDYSELPVGAFNGERKQWESLSPGMRREIFRSWTRQNSKPAPLPPPPY